MMSLLGSNLFLFNEGYIWPGETLIGLFLALHKESKNTKLTNLTLEDTKAIENNLPFYIEAIILVSLVILEFYKE